MDPNTQRPASTPTPPGFPPSSPPPDPNPYSPSTVYDHPATGSSTAQSSRNPTPRPPTLLETLETQLPPITFKALSGLLIDLNTRVENVEEIAASKAPFSNRTSTSRSQLRSPPAYPASGPSFRTSRASTGRTSRLTWSPSKIRWI